MKKFTIISSLSVVLLVIFFFLMTTLTNRNINSKPTTTASTLYEIVVKGNNDKESNLKIPKKEIDYLKEKFDEFITVSIQNSRYVIQNNVTISDSDMKQIVEAVKKRTKTINVTVTETTTSVDYATIKYSLKEGIDIGEVLVSSVPDKFEPYVTEQSKKEVKLTKAEINKIIKGIEEAPPVKLKDNIEIIFQKEDTYWKLLNPDTFSQVYRKLIII